MPQPPKLTITSTLHLSTHNRHNTIPILGLGVYRIKPSPDGTCQAACRAALEAGYHHIDSARLYRNEPQVRKAVDDFVAAGRAEEPRTASCSTTKNGSAGSAGSDDSDGSPSRKTPAREHVFLTTKIKESTGDEERDYRAAMKCIERLSGAQDSTSDQTHNSPDQKSDNKPDETTEGPRTKRRKTTSTTRSSSQPVLSATAPASAVPYVDLLLIHQPPSTLEARTALWRALERVHREGRAHNIGVSNYRIEHLKEMETYADSDMWPPSVNQIEVHPWFQQSELTEYCAAQGIVVEAFAPLAQGRKFVSATGDESEESDDAVVRIARKHGKTQAQVLIRWSLQKGYVALPKSSNPERIRENANVFDFELDEDDMCTLGELDQGGTAGATYKWNKI